MAKQESSLDAFFGGFEAVVGDLTKSTSSLSMPGGEDSPVDISRRRVNSDDDGNEYTIQDPSIVLQEDVEIIDEDAPIEEAEEVEEVEELEDTEEIEELEEEVITPEVEDEPFDLGEAEESDVVDFLTEKLEAELGWEIEEEEKPKSVADVVNYIKKLVEDNSAPDYADEEVEKINDYVRNGGDLNAYMKEVYGGLDLDSIDLESTPNQKAVVRENLERLGYSSDKIKKLIDRYEEAGTLEEEAEDAHEVLKEYNSKKSETLLEKVKKDQVDLKERQQIFFTDVKTSIEKLNSIRGIPITAQERKELTEYIFKPGQDGMTKYQKDYNKSYNNLIESAYFTMKGDSLISKVTRKATSQAAKSLQDKLAKKGKRAKNSGTQGGGGQNSLDAWSTVSSQLRRPRN